MHHRETLPVSLGVDDYFRYKRDHEANTKPYTLLRNGIEEEVSAVLGQIGPLPPSIVSTLPVFVNLFSFDAESLALPSSPRVARCQ